MLHLFKRILCSACCLLCAAVLPACTDVPEQTALTPAQQAEADAVQQRIADLMQLLPEELPQPEPTGDTVCDLINTERAKWNCTPLMLNSTLMHAAQVRLSEITQRGDAAGGLHTRPDGSAWSTVLTEFNLSKSHTGETVLTGGADAKTFVSAMLLNLYQTQYLVCADYRQLGYAYNETCDIWVLLLTE